MFVMQIRKKWLTSTLNNDIYLPITKRFLYLQSTTHTFWLIVAEGNQYFHFCKLTQPYLSPLIGSRQWGLWWWMYEIIILLFVAFNWILTFFMSPEGENGSVRVPNTGFWCAVGRIARGCCGLQYAIRFSVVRRSFRRCIVFSDFSPTSERICFSVQIKFVTMKSSH